MSDKYQQSRSIFLVIIIVFTITLIETIQISEGLGVTKTKLESSVNPGQDNTMTWKLVNNSDEKIWIEIFARGEGSEFLYFEEIVALEPRAVLISEVIVAIPEDHPTNIEYRPQIYALQRGDPEAGQDGAATATLNTQLRKTVTIKIGDDPIYTPPKEDIKSETPPAAIIPEKEAVKAKTLAEKLKEIEEKNKQVVRADEKIDDIFRESFEEEVVSDYVPEPTMDPEPVVEPTMDTEPVVEPTMDTEPVVEQVVQEESGGCLIATAAYGTELAPQVQFLREIRDNSVMSTMYGTSFMTGFNTLYYSFSPHIADLERENPSFREAVKIFITPMISTLYIMTLAEAGNNVHVLGLGILVISLNFGLYIATPTVISIAVRKRLKIR